MDDQSNEVPSVRYPPQLANDAVLDVRPDDQAAATQVEEWLQAYATSRDPQLREQIILAYLGMADRLAGRYRHSRGTTPEDLRQSARAGLIAAVDRYNPAYGNPFVPYAVACVVGELKRHLRDTSWRLHVPRPLKEQGAAVVPGGRRTAPAPGPLTHHHRAGRAAWDRGGGGPGGLAAAGSRLEVSLDQPVGEDGDVSLGDLMAAAGAREEPEDLLALPGLVAALPELEREVILLRFFKDLDQYEIAARVGFSQMHISRLQRRALARLRAQLVEP